MQNEEGYAILHFSVVNHDERMVKLLLSNEGINPNVQDFVGQIPLHCVTDRENKKMVKLLLSSNKVSPNILAFSDKLPIDLAYESNDIELIN